jgi:hypothetical protein
MKRIFLVILGITCSAACSPGRTPSLKPSNSRQKNYQKKFLLKPSPAWLTSIDNQRLSAYILEKLSTRLVQIGKQTIVETEQLDAGTKELDFQLSGEVSDESAQSIDKSLARKPSSRESSPIPSANIHFNITAIT